MRVQVTLGGALRLVVPTARVDVDVPEVGGRASVRSVLSELQKAAPGLGMPGLPACIVVMGGKVIPSSTWDSPGLSAGDALTIFPPLAGGE